MKPVKVGLLGLGTVGGGTVTVLTRNAREIARRAGRGIEIARAAARDYKPETIQGLEQVGRIGDDAFAVVDDPEIQIVVELIGGYSPARELVLKAIANGKHVVTANKALIARHGNEIFAAAQERGVMVGFEAAVAGGIPIIKALREGLAANHIEWIAGIINGTGNFILTEMRDKGRDFADVLAEAQALGYAEADPTFDVEGIDAAHKLTILGSLAFGIPLQFERCFTEGISRIGALDVAYAAELGYRIKHLGHRAALGRRHRAARASDPDPRASPDRQRRRRDERGAGQGRCGRADPLLWRGCRSPAHRLRRGRRSGRRGPRADDRSHNRVPHLAFQPDELADTPVLPMEEVETAYYLRLSALDQPGVMARIASILGEQGISIEAIKQKEPGEGETHVPLVMLTHRVIEGRMNEAIARIEALESVQGPVMRIRMESLSG